MYRAELYHKIKAAKAQDRKERQSAARKLREDLGDKAPPIEPKRTLEVRVHLSLLVLSLDSIHIILDVSSTFSILIHFFGVLALYIYIYIGPLKTHGIFSTSPWLCVCVCCTISGYIICGCVEHARA